MIRIYYMIRYDAYVFFMALQFTNKILAQLYSNDIIASVHDINLLTKMKLWHFTPY